MSAISSRKRTEPSARSNFPLLLVGLGMSGFSGSNLDSYLRNNQINRIYLAGYALHVCVESTLRDGHDRGYEVILLEDATSAFNSEQRDYVLKNVVHHFGAHISVEEFASVLNRAIESN